MRDTPAIAPDGSVWIGTHYNPTMYKLNGATGAVLCSSKAQFGIDASPIVVTPPGGQSTVYYQVVDGDPIPGPIIALNESNCATIWNFNNYIGLGGGWATPSYGVSATGEPLIMAGDADPDETMYTMDAVTGNRVWYFQTEPNQDGQDWDIGSAATVSAPGNNGFADGVLYLNNKAGYEWALDLTTGAVIWQTNLFPNGGQIDVRASAALDGTTLVVGDQAGIVGMNAITGAILWSYSTPLEVISSPAIIGPIGSEVVTFGDVAGMIHINALAGGGALYGHQTGGYISSSPAEANGKILIASSDGFLYALAMNGSNNTAPAAVISTPTAGSSVANPNGNLAITGTATDAVGVGAVEVAIESNGPSGPWWNGATSSFGGAPTRNAATLATPGATSTSWSYSFPAPAAGGTFTVIAGPVNTGNVDGKTVTETFTILPSSSEANITAPVTVAAPLGGFEVSGAGFKAGETVAYSMFGKVVNTVKAQKNGTVLPHNVAVPGTATLGPTSVTATGETSGTTTTLAVIISNEWSQQGGGPTRTGFESFDNIITKSVGFGKSTVLSLAWDYATGAPVNSSPSVFNGVVYVGNDVGALSAIVANTAAPQWTYTIASGAPIRSSPAIDALGNVIFGANDGNLYTLNKSGALVNTLSLGGNLGAPAVANDQIIIGSSSGELYDVAEATNTVTWSAQLAGTPAAPSYDAVAGIVVDGDSSGHVTAFNATTGAQLWQVTTGGPITGTAAIAKGVVYVGSGDANLYALNETTGAQNFKFTADSAILGGPTIFNLGQISFGSQNGILYQLLSNGTLYYAQPNTFFAGSSILSTAAVPNNVVTETLKGQVGITRNNPPELPWKYQTGAGLGTSPAINDGAVYIGAADGGLYAFTPEGKPPQPARVPAAAVVTITDAWSCTQQR
jgi:outer membrane protein assembly factor BamB